LIEIDGQRDARGDAFAMAGKARELKRKEPRE
jgi:hypothetical protein